MTWRGALRTKSCRPYTPMRWKHPVSYTHLDVYKRQNINCVVDATGDLLKNVLKYIPFLIKPNHHELGDLFSVQIKSDDDIVKYSKKLQEMGASNVLVSMAKDGAMLGRKRKRPQNRQRKGQAHKLRRLRRQYGSRLYGRIY